MKKIALLILAFLMLCGCSKYGGKVTPMLSSISFTANVSFYNEVFICDGLIEKDHTLTLVVKEPEDIEGMTITIKNGAVTAEYKGISYTPSTGTFPFGSVAESTYMVLSDARERLYPVKYNSDVFYIESAENDKYYKIILSSTGLPLSLEYPSKGLSILFMNTTIL